jgi:hypothetical protein
VPPRCSLIPGVECLILVDRFREDEQELHQIAESEGTDLPTIHRRVLKTGREIWTIGEASTANDEDDVWSYD